MTPIAENTIRWFDSHCHLSDAAFADDLDGVLERAAAEGVERIVAMGDTVASCRDSLALAERMPNIHAAIGLHPHHARDWSDAVAEEIDSLILSAGKRVVAVGETGIDLHFPDSAPRAMQARVFLDHAELARKHRLPLAIHVRDAYDLLLELVREHNLGAVGGVVHCFSGTPDEAAELAEAGFLIGVTGVMTFRKNQPLLDVVRTVPLESLVLETDAPYLAPVPHRGRRNEPSFLPKTGHALALALGRPVADVARALWGNTMRLYRLD